MKKLDQNGSHVLAIALVIVVLGVVGFAGYKVFGSSKNNDSKPKTSDQKSQTDQNASSVTWMFGADGYTPSGTPPACPDPMITTFPADISKVTSVLYPGQYRGQSYKPHGGLRFDTIKDNQMTVKAPFSGTIVKGVVTYAEGTDDIQYGFDVMNDCGQMYRIGHLLTLSSELAEVAKKLPPPTKGDSRDTTLDPVFIKEGTVLATAVGTTEDDNTFFDFGVFDWNKPNEISSDATWLAGDQHNTALAKHALCWFDELNAKDKAVAYALPAGGSENGKTSDYCK